LRERRAREAAAKAREQKRTSAQPSRPPTAGIQPLRGGLQ